MANELTLTGSVTYDDAVRSASLSVSTRQVNITTKRPIKFVQNIGTSEEALELGDITPRYAMIRNLDTTNFVSFRVASGGANAIRLSADTAGTGKGGFMIVEFGSGMTAPFLIADTAACDVEVLLVPA